MVNGELLMDLCKVHRKGGFGLIIAGLAGIGFFFTGFLEKNNDLVGVGILAVICFLPVGIWMIRQGCKKHKLLGCKECENL